MVADPAEAQTGRPANARKTQWRDYTQILGAPISYALTGSHPEPHERGDLAREAFRTAADGPRLDIAVTIETPEGDRGLMLTEIATAEGGIVVVGRERRWP